MGYLSCNAESAIATCDPYNCKIKNKSKNSSNNDNQIRRFSPAELEAATAGFSRRSFLGKGSHGSVFRAVLDGGNLIAAVKKTTTITNPNNNDAENIDPAENELEILSRLRSPRLVNLLGYAEEEEDDEGKQKRRSRRKWIVVEYMPNGSLFDLLHTSPRPPGWTARLRFALQIAQGVAFLHAASPLVIHRDIKSSNVLLDRRRNARLGDLGLAVSFGGQRVGSTRPPAGTLGYLDPCYLAPGDLSAKSDVFSFGILLLELLSGRQALDLNRSPPSVVDWAPPLIAHGDFAAILDPRIAPPTAAAAAAEATGIRRLAALASRCVSSKPDERPSMAEAVSCLESVVGKRRGGVVRGGPSPAGCSGFMRRRCMVETSPEDEGALVSKQQEQEGGRRSEAAAIAAEELKRNGAKTDRSRSVGSGGGGNLRNKGGGVAVRMGAAAAAEGLSRSRSMGFLQGRVHFSEQKVAFQILRRRERRKSTADFQGLLVSVVNKEEVEKKKNRKNGGDESDERPLMISISNPNGT